MGKKNKGWKSVTQRGKGMCKDPEKEGKFRDKKRSFS